MQLFIDPKETTELRLFTDGVYWIRIKKYLSARDTKEVQQAGQMQFITTQAQAQAQADKTADPNAELKMGLNLGAMELARAQKYILAWNLDYKGGSIDVSPEAIGNLMPAVFEEIKRVLDGHEKAVAEEKKEKAGEPTSATA